MPGGWRLLDHALLVDPLVGVRLGHLDEHGPVGRLVARRLLWRLRELREAEGLEQQRRDGHKDAQLRSEVVEHAHALEAEGRVPDVWQQPRGAEADLDERVRQLAQRRVRRLGESAQGLRPEPEAVDKLPCSEHVSV